MYSVIGVVLCSIFASVYSQRPTITQDMKPVIKNRGDTAELQCHVKFPRNNPFEYKVRWNREMKRGSYKLSENNRIDTPFNSATADGQLHYDVDVSRTGSSYIYVYSLIIRGLVRDDTGFYTCQVIIPGDRDFLHKKVEVRVTEPPTISGHTINEKSFINGSSEMFCEAEGVPRPTIQWAKVSGHHLSMPKDHIFENKILSDRKFRSVLKMKNLQKDDRGTFRCLASNNVPTQSPVERTILLAIEYKPSTRTTNPVVTAYLNKPSAKLSCISSGDPVPQVTWVREQKPNVKLTTGSKYLVQESRKGAFLRSGETYHTLVVKDIRSSDFGYYVCKAENRHGIATSRVNLYQSNQQSYNVIDRIRDEVRSDTSRSAVSVVLLAVLAPLHSILHML